MTTPASRFRWWADRPVETALATALVSWVAILVLFNPIGPHDFWWHLALGRLVVAEGQVPTVDSFSYTRAGATWHNSYWLAQVIFYELHQLGGLALIIAVNAVVIAAAYVLLLGVCARRSRDVALSAGVLALTVIPVTMDNWAVRPQSLVLPIFAAYLSILDRHLDRGRGRLWLLPLLMTLWVNLHGTFLLGLVLIGLSAAALVFEAYPAAFGLDRAPDTGARGRLSELVRWGAVTSAAVMLNPAGVGAVTFVLSLVRSDVVTSFAAEWAPPSSRNAFGVAFFLFVIVCGVVTAYAPRRPRLVDAMLGIPFLWLALGARRSVIWFVFIAAPILCGAVSQVLGARPSANRKNGAKARREYFPAVLIAGASIAVLVSASPWVRSRSFSPDPAALVTSDTPVRAVEFLKGESSPPRRLFHPSGYGSYFTWAWPDQPVFVDPRIELYPREQWTDYLNLSDARHVDAIVTKYQFDGLLLERSGQSALIEYARSRSDAWLERYSDDISVYFVRK